jgi:hypothetical protein
MQWFITALIALIGGAIGSLIAPWVHWSIEKRKLKLEYRRKLICEWRESVDSFEWDEDCFGSSSTYAAMRPHMTEQARKIFETPRTVFVSPEDSRGQNMQKRVAVDEISRIEMKWGLV